jgi:hypothetical protein
MVRDVAVVIRICRVLLEGLGFLTSVEPSAKSAISAHQTFRQRATIDGLDAMRLAHNCAAPCLGFGVAYFFIEEVLTGG